MVIVGVDISKDHIDCALVRKSNPDVFIETRFTNNLKGFESLERWLCSKETELKEVLFCMEHTGTYGLLLWAWLSCKEIDFCVEPGLKIKRSLGLVRGKNDRIDARRIADYALTHLNKLTLFSFPSGSLLEIKQLLTYRDQMARFRKSLKNSIHNHLQYEQITGKNKISASIEEQIRTYDRIIDDIEKEVLNIIKSDPELKKNFELATSVKGIGLVIASYMIVTTNNFTSFKNGRKYACYSGLAPFEHSSGSSIKGKTKTSPLANRYIKALLLNGANSASKWDPEIKAFYKRKLNEGKEHKVVMNAVGCKLINRVFAVVKRQTPYVITYQQKVA